MHAVSALLSAEMLRHLEQLQLIARGRARAGLKGERRSRARGQSVEFADHRNYASGDDLRYLDWNLYGRLDRLFLRLYEEERELPVTLFLDASESMSFGEPRKFDVALQLAAAAGYVALCGFDRVQVMLLPRQLDFSEEERASIQALRLVRGKASAISYLKHLSALKAGGACRLNEGLKQASAQSRLGGLAVVLSDFLDPEGYEEGLMALLSRGFEVAAIQILSPQELSPNHYGDLQLVDSETGETRDVTFSRHRLEAYRSVVLRYVEQLKGFCSARGISFAQCASDTRLERLFLEQLREAEVWR